MLISCPSPHPCPRNHGPASWTPCRWAHTGGLGVTALAEWTSEVCPGCSECPRVTPYGRVTHHCLDDLSAFVISSFW